MAVSVMEQIGVYIVTFNCARNPVDADLFASSLFDTLPSREPASSPLPEILVLSLQELAPVSYAFLGGYLLEPYYEAFRHAVAQGAGDGRYQNVLTRNVGMIGIMVFVRDDVADRVSWIETAEAGVGVQEAGNKGAVGVRLGYLVHRDDDNMDTVSLTFVAAHLAPDEYAVEKRNEDWKNISQRLVFTRVDGSSETPQETTYADESDEEGVPLLDSSRSFDSGRTSSLYAPGSYLFVAGDLNYRTSHERPQDDDFVKFPQPTDDATDRRHCSHLLADDQLTQERHAHRTLQNLTEEPIEFPPTYKYATLAPGGGVDGEWNWTKNRWPSWCDRILYLDTGTASSSADNDGGRIMAHKYDALPLFPTSDHRPVALSVSVPPQAAAEPAGQLASLFEVDPDWESRRAAARRKEILAGATAYGLFTWEGNAVVLATCLGVSAGYYAIRTYLSGW